MKIRIKFRKYGTMRLIGHLDVMRHFQKAICRADVDVCYNGGFSPHQITSFTTPLGVGNTSNGEHVDIEVSSTKDPETMRKCLNGATSEDSEVVSYRGLPDDAANVMSIVGAGDRTLAFRLGYEPEDMDKETWFQGLIALLERPNVMATKKIKRGDKEMDLKPLAYELRICPEGDGEVEGLRLFMKISAGSAANVRPERVLDAYYRFLGKERSPPTFMVQRGEVYADRASDIEKKAGIHSLISLEQLGEEIR